MNKSSLDYYTEICIERWLHIILTCLYLCTCTIKWTRGTLRRVLLLIDTDISWGSGSLNLCQVFIPFFTTGTRHRNHYDVMFCSSPLTTATTIPRSFPQEDSIKGVHSSSRTSFIHAGTTSESNWIREKKWCLIKIFYIKQKYFLVFDRPINEIS